MANYVVVHFEDENDNSVEAIPKSWLQEGNKFGYWPLFRSTGQIKNAIKNATELVVGVWKLCRLRVLQQYGTLEAARKHSKTAEYQSNLESDYEKANHKQNTKRKHYSNVDNLDYLSEIEKQSQEQYDEHRLPTTSTFPGGIFKKMHGNKSEKIRIHDMLESSTLAISKQNITEQKKYEKLDKFTLDSASNVSDKWHSKSPGLSMFQGEADHAPFEKVSTSFQRESGNNQDDHPTLLHSICARLTKIEQKLDTCLAQQKMILNVVRLSDIAVTLPANISLPLRTIIQLEHLEQILLEKASMDAVVMHLGQFGGRTVAETVKNILSELMATEVAQQLNFEGRGGQK
ncbi:uncharacterized protein LOC101235899 [Hydra vulgaris]|uniref:uncharacterized protein LOC101235899 n=1 Tax=Hydra vulgaris TaxID=6087 RepID=UPI0002B4815D|nr:uncharacterized protein LOC101235899 [Hydra vulgaris]